MTTRTKVLHVFKDAFPPTYGGVEQHVWQLTRSLAGEFECVWLTSSRSRERIDEWVDGVRIVRAPEYGRMFSTPVTPAWWRPLREAYDTVVHHHLPDPVGELATLMAPTDHPVVASFHADVVRYGGIARCYLRLRRRFLARADRIVVGSRILADTSPVLAPHRSRVVVVPYGVEPQDWTPDPVRVAEVRAAHDAPLVVFVGRLVYYKGVDVLIEAMRSVDATLVVVGDGPERPRLQRLALSAGLGPRVRFTGTIPDRERAAYQRAASVCVLPAVSRAETFGIAMLEAMSLGTPVVSTEVGTATSWVNRSEETGLVVPPGCPASLSRALRVLLTDDRRRSEMGEAAARRAVEHFSKQAMLDRLADLYRSAAATGFYGRVAA